MNIFIGNLGNEVASHDIFLLFSRYGGVAAAQVAKDKNGSSRGFGYVFMKVHSEGSCAIAALNKKRFMGQFLSVSEAIHNARYCDAIAVSMGMVLTNKLSVRFTGGNYKQSISMSNNQTPEQKPEQAGNNGKQPQTNANPSGAPLRQEQEITERATEKTAEPKANTGDDSE